MGWAEVTFAAANVMVFASGLSLLLRRRRSLERPLAWFVPVLLMLLGARGLFVLGVIDRFELPRKEDLLWLNLLVIATCTGYGVTRILSKRRAGPYDFPDPESEGRHARAIHDLIQGMTAARWKVDAGDQEGASDTLGRTIEEAQAAVSTALRESGRSPSRPSSSTTTVPSGRFSGLRPS